MFTDPSAEGIAAALDTYCRRELGAEVAVQEFADASVGSVHGLRLSDGRRVVVKVHDTRVSVAFLKAMQRVQRALAAGGYPAPAPLAGPAPLDRGIAVAETLLDAGEKADPREPAVRRPLAAGLAELIDRCCGLTGVDALAENLMRLRGGLWPPPHDRRIDLTVPGGDWIDALAARALPLRASAGEPVVGHGDWRMEHVRFRGGRLTAVYDWDSLQSAPEPTLVGSAAHAFTADWSIEGRRQLPSLEEALAFIADYEVARERPFPPAERRAALASLVYTTAYTARCEHSDAVTGAVPTPVEPPPGSARALLAAHGEALLS